MSLDLETIKFFNKVFCFNQLQLAEYDFLADDKHKKIKQLANKHSKEDLKNKLLELEEFLYKKFGLIFDVNCEYIIEFFENDRGSFPRICLKIIIGGEIVTLYRNPEYPFENKPFKISENKAFQAISKGDKYEYLCNNIPLEIYKGSYYNKRIIKDKAIAYQKSKDRQKESASFDVEGFDMDWVQCWEKPKFVDQNQNKLVSPPPKTCYKSTLVIPMSLSTKNMDEDFRTHLRIISTPARAIFGFLCLDHHTTNFFKKDIDIPFLYFFADLFSVYFIKQINNTQRSSVYSKVFSEVKDKINQENKEIELS